MRNIRISHKQFGNLKSYVDSTKVVLVEGKRYHIECPLCNATEPYIYENGSSITPKSMSSITHQDSCPYETIRDIYSDNIENME